MKHFGGQKLLLFFKAASWVFGVLVLAQCGLKLYCERPSVLREPGAVIAESEGHTSILVFTELGWCMSLSNAIMLSFALFLAAFVGTVLLKRKQKREKRRRNL